MRIYGELASLQGLIYGRSSEIAAHLRRLREAKAEINSEHHFPGYGGIHNVEKEWGITEIDDEIATRLETFINNLRR